jgi:predicted nucleotidyltransferase component of viral defense system
MKEYALELAQRAKTAYAKLSVMREYLQAYILRIMHDDGVFRGTAFIGGTALRFLHDLPRYSEDLDFSCSLKDPPDFAALMNKIKSELALAGYQAGITYNDVKTVKSAFVKFSGLLFEAGISPLRDQKFSVKIEVDSNPPSGAVTEVMVVNKYFPLAFLTYDIPSLFAGKIHALLSRKYTKGRDFFDLGWYLSRWRDLTPNLLLLKNALEQTGWKQDMPAEATWRDRVRDVVQSAEWNKVDEDISSFLENPSDRDVFSRENILRLLTR